MDLTGSRLPSSEWGTRVEVEGEDTIYRLVVTEKGIELHGALIHPERGLLGSKRLFTADHGAWEDPANRER